MNKSSRHILGAILAGILFVLTVTSSWGLISPDEKIAPFKLTDVSGIGTSSKYLSENPFSVLYFFTLDSKPSREGLIALNELVQTYGSKGMRVLGLSPDDSNALLDFKEKMGIRFPLAYDEGGVADKFGVGVIYPVVILLGPDGVVLESLEGGGATTQHMLFKIAQRELSRNETKVAAAIGEKLVKKKGGRVQGMTLLAHSNLKQGKLDRAKTEFEQIANMKGEQAAIGKEGLAQVHYMEGNYNQALKLAQEVEQVSGPTAATLALQGNVQYEQGKVQEAKKSYQAATEAPATMPWENAVPYNKLGLTASNEGSNTMARNYFEKAVQEDRYYLDALSNMGLTFEKEGNLQEAQNYYRKVLSMNPHDRYAGILARRVEELIKFNLDLKKRKRIDELIDKLVERYNKTSALPEKEPEDTWTSRPMTIAFLDFPLSGALPERDGISGLFTYELGNLLQSTGRVKIVERRNLDKTLEELNLGSNELADPSTRIRLGRILAAKLITAGRLMSFPDGFMLSLRMIDTETTAIPIVIAGRKVSTRQKIEWMEVFAKDILGRLKQNFPLRGIVIGSSGSEIILNIGSKHGAVPGVRMQLLEEGAEIRHGGRVLGRESRKIGEVTISRTEAEFSYARIVKSERTPDKGLKVQEVL